MSEIKIIQFNLKTLKKKFDRREFGIPEIQRQYIWKKSQILNLMDSIFKNYPVGISLIWEAPFAKTLQIRPNNKTIIPPFNKQVKKLDLIIDGQQRLSTVYGLLFACEPKQDANLQFNFKELFFNCDKKAKNRFLFSKNLDEDSKGYARLTDLLNTKPSEFRKKIPFTKAAYREVLKCYNTFHNYRFYVLAFTGMDLKDVREIFIRINSAGMTISRADSFFTRATTVGLRDHMLDAQRGLGDGFKNISIDALQNALILAYGAKIINKREQEVFLREIEKNGNGKAEFQKNWKDLNYGYTQAVDFLTDTLKVTKSSLLPSQNIFSVLSYFFFLNRSRAKPYQTRELKKWFWHTACGERYSGANFNRCLPDDIKFFKKLAAKTKVEYKISAKLNPTDLLKTSYKNSSSMTNAYYILLRNMRPLYLDNCKEIILDGATSSANRKDRHHIFPHGLLKRKEINPKWINSVVNICYLERDNNQSFQDSHPKNYLYEYKKVKFFSKVMRSHMIPVKASSPIWLPNAKNEFRDFINLRGQTIIHEIEKLAGVKLFVPFDKIKRI